MIADRVGQYVQAYTLYSSVRPFGISAILATVDKSGPSMYMIEPSGIYYVCYALRFIIPFFPIIRVIYNTHQGFYGCAIGKGRQVAKTEIEKLKLTEITCREAVKEAARMYVYIYIITIFIFLYAN